MRRMFYQALFSVHLLAACQQPPAVIMHAGDRAHIPDKVDRDLRTIIEERAIPDDSVRLVVRKAARLLMVVASGDTLKRYPCVLGEAPVGDKSMQGDRCTPEGTFTFRDKYPHREWHKFAWIDYPNEESWRRFRQRKRDGLIPANAAIGGEIGIHGVPEGMDHWIGMGHDWTFGCIAMRNADLDELWTWIRPRSSILVILP
ncbi:MAG: L,D-transpeptidase [Flavobacteriales bacterium]|nr:L,D-transpeptidase [Flavobacteriales bacterium]